MSKLLKKTRKPAEGQLKTKVKFRMHTLSYGYYMQLVLHAVSSFCMDYLSERKISVLKITNLNL
jgi:hypothetical protein